MLKTQAYWKLHSRRTQILSLARGMARSGRHEGHQSIIAELEAVDGFGEAQKFLTPGIRWQLDRLCVLARRAAPKSSN